MKSKRQAPSSRKLTERQKKVLAEAATRPSPWAGYDHDRLALHRLARESFDVAEAELSHAVAVNPYESLFKQHLAWCLYQRKQHAEARRWILDALKEDPGNPDSESLRRLIETTLQPGPEDKGTP